MISTVLEKIAAHKKLEIKQLLDQILLSSEHSLARIYQSHASLDHPREGSGAFKKALLSGKTPAVIAEVKRRSPSVGEISQIPKPEILATSYAEGGAAAISVLTDSYGFGGSLDDLMLVSRTLKTLGWKTPLLRKDFILHPLQLLETVQSGADAVLLIAALLGNDLAEMVSEARRLGLDSLVEVHTQEELEKSLAAGAEIIGVNQRNLKTFEMHPEVFQELIASIPDSVIAVAESGISSPEQAHAVKNLGYDAVLVGEALVRAENPGKFIRNMQENQFSQRAP